MAPAPSSAAAPPPAISPRFVPPPLPPLSCFGSAATFVASPDALAAEDDATVEFDAELAAVDVPALDLPAVDFPAVDVAALDLPDDDEPLVDEPLVDAEEDPPLAADVDDEPPEVDAGAPAEVERGADEEVPAVARLEVEEARVEVELERVAVARVLLGFGAVEVDVAGGRGVIGGVDGAAPAPNRQPMLLPCGAGNDAAPSWE